MSNKPLEIVGAKYNRIEDCTIGPVPVMGLVNIMRQLREQDWKITFVAFSGMIMAQEKIVTANRNRPPVPSYVIIAEKLFGVGEGFIPPKINMTEVQYDVA